MVEIYPGAVREIWLDQSADAHVCIVIDRDHQQDWWNVVTAYGHTIAYSTRIFDIGKSRPYVDGEAFY